jgi:hypothetical protein
MTNRVYDFTLAAVLGASQRFDVSGAYVKVLSAPGGNIGVKLDGGQEIALLEGQGFRLAPGSSFRDVTIRNLQAASNVGTIFIGDSGFEDSRIAGVVQVIDTERRKVIDNNAFRASMSQAGGGAGSTCIQIFNPAASGKLLYVNGITIGQSANDTYGIHTTTTAAPTLVDQSRSLDVSGVDGVSQARSGNDATVYAITRTLMLGYATGLVDREILFPRPVLLRPGTGLRYLASTAATALRGGFDLEEWPE